MTNILCYAFNSCKTVKLNGDENFSLSSEYKLNSLKKCSESEIKFAKEEMEKV